MEVAFKPGFRKRQSKLRAAIDVQRAGIAIRRRSAGCNGGACTLHGEDMRPHSGPAQQAEFARDDKLRIAQPGQKFYHSGFGRIPRLGVMLPEPAHGLGIARTQGVLQFPGALALLFEVGTKR